MPKVNVPQVIDDYDGKTLDAETQPTNISYMGQRFELYLSDANQEKLFDFLRTFTKDASPVHDNARGKRPGSQGSGDDKKAKAERSKTVRAWALEKNIEVGGKALGERGRVPDAFVTAWENAGSPGIGEVS